MDRKWFAFGIGKEIDLDTREGAEDVVREAEREGYREGCDVAEERGALLRALKATLERTRALEAAAALEERSRIVQRAAARRIRDAFQETYGAFWKCRRCGGYIGSRPAWETTPPGYVCPYCGSTDNMAHGYAPPQD